MNKKIFFLALGLILNACSSQTSYENPVFPQGEWKSVNGAGQ